ncbi:MAG: hypothetical protein QRY72_02825 [Candidatus Rhabdochlamydia sp.]
MSIHHVQHRSTSTLSPPLLLIADQLTQKVKNLCQDWKNNAQVRPLHNQLEALYQEGVELVKAEARSTPLTTMVLTQVITTLMHEMDWVGIQHHQIIHRSLSKVCRIFFELMAFRLIENESSLSLETKRGLFHQINAILQNISTDSYLTRFEYECALAALKRFPVSLPFMDFKPQRSLWEKITSYSLSHVREQITDAIEIREMNKVSRWSIEVAKLSWRARLIQTSEDVDRIISPIIKKFYHQGNHYTLGLAVIYKDLLETSSDQDVKITAQQGLLHLNHLTRPPFLMLNQQDQYASTRLLIEELRAMLVITDQEQKAETQS